VPRAARGRRRRRRDERLRCLVRRSGGRIRPRRLADVRAEPADVHRGSQFAFVGVIGAGASPPRPRRSPRPRCSASATSPTGCAWPRWSGTAGAASWRPTSRSTSRRRWRWPTEPRRGVGLLDHGRRHLRRLEPLDAPRCAARRRARRSSHLRAGRGAAAAFLALLWPRLRRRQAIAVGVAAAVVATALTPVLMPGVPVLVAAVVALAVGWTNAFAGRAS
jgi:hypothetical protein